jgi:hypothetical protein
VAALFAAIIACAKLAGLDESQQIIAAVSVQRQWVMPSAYVPVNRFRGEATPGQVIYRRPLSDRVTGIIVFGFMYGMAASALWLAAVSGGVISSPYQRENPWMSLLMLAAALVLGGSSWPALGMACPQELRISPRDRTYTFRVGAQPVSPVLRALMTCGVRDGLQDEIGLPWRMDRFTGACTDIAGIEILEMPVKQNTLYVIRIRWHLSDRPCMRLGVSRREGDALALQAQAAEDLGVCQPCESFRHGKRSDDGR